MLDREETIEKKKHGIGYLTFLILGIVVGVLIASVIVLRIMGRNHLTTAIVSATESVSIGEKQEEALDENLILYQGKTYAPNEDIITILAMGIDKETVDTVGGQSWESEEGSYLSGGQADALFLLVINPHDKTVKVVTINRNSMTDIDVWDRNGNYKGQFIRQIALQHGYGYGDEESCLRQVRAVSRMFHDIPIHSYVAISMDVVPKLNDALGGVTVEVPDTIVYPEYNMNLHQGETVTLYGEQAYWYVRLRDENVFNSNQVRQNRQIQYLTALALKAKEQATSDIRVVLQLYQTVSAYMVTDIDLSAFTYLVTEIKDYTFDTDSIQTLKGEVFQGNRFEEFYVDDAALQELIIDLFYEPVTE